MLVIVSLRTTWAAAFHDGCWGAKFLIVAGIWISSLWIPNDPVINGYMEFARIISVLFLLYQAMLILVVAYKLNDTLVTNVDKEGGSAFSCSGIILIVIFITVTAGNITLLVFEYKEFGNSGCGANITWLIISSVLGVLMYGVVFLRTRKDASMLTSAIVWCYQLYLQWSAMASSPDTSCNPYYNSATNTTLMIMFGLFFTFMSLLALGASTTKGGDGTVTSDMSAHVMEKEEDSTAINYESVINKADTETGKSDPEKDHIFPISTATIIFQALMVLASIYFSMLMTNWGNPTVMDESYGFFSINYWSYWVQMVALWMSQGLYVFSLTAPICFPNRDFGE